MNQVTERANAPRYVVLTPNIFSERDWRRFGCAEFRDAGYEVVQLCLSKLSGIEAADISRPNVTPLASARIIETRADLATALGMLKVSDLILMEFRFSEETAWIYHEISQRHLTYFYLDVALLPWNTGPEWRVIPFAQWVWLKIGDLADRIRSAINMIQLSLSHDYAHLVGPWLWVTAGRPDTLKHLTAPKRFGVPRLSVPSGDWSAIRADAHAALTKSYQRTAVFIDEAFADHPDFRLMGRASPVDGGSYWAALERFFIRLEEDVGVRVIVAPHPKSNMQFPAYISKRVTNSPTVTLIRNCALVLAHCSTAIGLAVAVRCPIMLLSTDAVEQSIYGALIARFSSWLAVRRWNVDQPQTWKKLSMAVVNRAAYERYECRFMRNDDATSASNIWSSVIEAHRSFLHIQEQRS